MRAQLKEYMERLPEPFFVEEIEMRCKNKTPYVVVALQEVRACATSERQEHCCVLCYSMLCQW